MMYEYNTFDAVSVLIYNRYIYSVKYIIYRLEAERKTTLSAAVQTTYIKNEYYCTSLQSAENITINPILILCHDTTNHNAYRRHFIVMYIIIYHIMYHTKNII